MSVQRFYLTKQTYRNAIRSLIFLMLPLWLQLVTFDPQMIIAPIDLLEDRLCTYNLEMAKLTLKHEIILLKILPGLLNSSPKVSFHKFEVS